MKNADRVLELTIAHGHRSLPLSESAWYEVAHSRPHLTIFPYLEKIIGGASGINGLFMADTISRVDVRLNCGNTTSDVAVARSFVARFEHYMPSVQSLHVRGYVGFQDIFTTIFGRLGGSLRLLKEITVPAEFLNPVFFNHLASLVFLETIAVDVDRHGRLTFSDDGQAHAADDMGLDFRAGSFPELRRFALSMLSSGNAIRIFSHTHFPTWRLASICLQFPYGWQLPSIDVGGVIGVLAQSCHCLEEFVLCYAEWCRATSMIETDDCERIKIRDILPIFCIGSLISLSIQHPHTLLFQDGDMDALALAASGLRILWLNPWPRWNVDHELLSLSDVTLFSRHCPLLVRLGISCDCVVEDVAPFPFESLEELFIGDTSFALEEPEDDQRYDQLSSTAVYLSSLLPPGCKLTSINTGSDGIMKPFRERCLHWRPNSPSHGWRVLLATVGLLMEEKESVFVEARRLHSEERSLEEEITRLTAGWL